MVFCFRFVVGEETPIKSTQLASFAGVQGFYISLESLISVFIVRANSSHKHSTTDRNVRSGGVTGAATGNLQFVCVGKVQRV